MNADDILERVIHSNDALPLAEQVDIMEQVVSLLQDHIDQLKADNWSAFLTPGCTVVTTHSGFSRPAGHIYKFLGFISKGTTTKDNRPTYTDDYLAFGYDAEHPQWLVHPHEWYLHVKRVD